MDVLKAGRAARSVSVIKVVPPQDGGWSLMPMENLLRGFRGASDTVSLELFGVDGVLSYGVRTSQGETMNGMFNAYFPQADVSSHLMGKVPGEAGESDAGDWLLLDEDERALVQPLGLSRDSYLPLRVFDDRVIQQGQVDPLAGIIGVISSNTSQGSGSGSDRMGIRLVIRPAPENWNAPWQNLMQDRRDGDDRTPKAGSPGADTGPSMRTVLSLGGLGGIAAFNWLLWNSGNIPGLVLFDGAALAAGLGGFYLWRKFSGGRKRPYLDELLVEEKLKSLGFWTELQIVRIYRGIITPPKAPGPARAAGDAETLVPLEAETLAVSDTGALALAAGDAEALARSGLKQVIDCIRSFDDPAGNSWDPGKVLKYDGSRILHRDQGHHPFVGGDQILGWVNSKRARRTVLSAREAASVWHLPLGMGEMASMERIASGALIPFLGDLSSGNVDSGPLVGKSGTRDIRLPESSIRKHAVILGRSGVGKSTLIKHIIDYKLRRKAEGKDEGAIVVIDPHADLVHEIMELVPPEIAHKVRLLDFGRMDRVPGINLVDPKLFPGRDRCVDTIINTVKHLWEHWGSRLETLLHNSLLIVYEFNSHPDTLPEKMLTMLDILLLLEDGVESGQGRNTKTEMSPFQRRVLERVKDPRLKQWLRMYLDWPRETRAEAVGPVHSRIGAYASDERASVIMGQRQSTILLGDVLSEGLVLLVSTAQGSIGKGPAALMGGTIVSLMESALRAQEILPPADRAKCLLVCDEFQTVTGADWEGLFAEIRKYGCSMMLATQSLARLDTSERKLKAGVLANVGVIIGYQMAAEDARIISAEMDAERVPEKYLINLNPHHCCVRINSDTVCYPAFSMRTLPPPDQSRGSPEAVQAILDASEAYTVDFAEARELLNREVQQQLDSSNKFGVVSSDDDETEAGKDASADPSGVYEQAARSGAAKPPSRSGAAQSPNRASRRAEKSRGKAERAESESAGDPASAVSDSAAAESVDDIAAAVASLAAMESSFSGAVDTGPTSAGPAVTPFDPSPEAGAAPAESAVTPFDPSPEAGAAPAAVSVPAVPVPVASTVRQVPGVNPDDAEASGLTIDALGYVYDKINEDPALRGVVDKRVGNQISRGMKRARVELESEIDSRVEAEVAEQVGAAERAAGERSLVQARKEMAAVLSDAGPERNLDRLRRPDSEA